MLNQLNFQHISDSHILSERWQKWFWGAVVAQWVTTLLFVGSGWRWHEQLHASQQLLYTRSTWTIKKLERIEKALGILPK